MKMKLKIKIIAMKKSTYNLFLLSAAILLIGTISLSGQEISKDFSKTFTLKPSMGVILSNKYGDINIETWDKNEVVIDVKVTVELSSVERSEKLISLIVIDFFESDTALGARTIFDDKFSSVTRGAGSNSFSIDYKVRMPGRVDLNVSNRYGDINMADYSGRLTADVRYGNFVALKLLRGNEKPINSISIAYGKGTIEDANWLSVVTRYSSGLSITKVQAMTLDSRYSKTIIDKAGSIVGVLKYDNLTIGEINNLSIEAGYTPIKAENLKKTLDLTTRYGSFSAATIPVGFEDISIDAGYAGITLGIDQAAKYRLDVKTRYGSLSYCEECLDIIKRIQESNSRELSAIAGGDPNPSASVTIVSSYGSVRLK
jgi:hypothetical protein